MPPWISTRWRTIDRPRPRPPWARVADDHAALAALGRPWIEVEPRKLAEAQPRGVEEFKDGVVATAEGVATGVGAGVANVPGDGAYPTGGTAAFTEFIRKKEFKLYGGWRVINVEGWAIISSVLHILKYDRVNDKLLVFTGADGTQVADTTDLSATTFNAMVWAE